MGQNISWKDHLDACTVQQLYKNCTKCNIYFLFFDQSGSRKMARFF